VELLISEEEAEEFEEWSSEEEEIVEKTAEVSWLLICINEKKLNSLKRCVRTTVITSQN